MPQSVEVEKRIREGLPATHVEVRDTTGGGDHFEVLVVSPAFEGKTRVQQHQLVYSALGEQMKGAIHALSLQTLTPEQREQVSR
jgi:stress-induced morphogen